MGGVFHSAVFDPKVFQTDDNIRVVNETLEINETDPRVRGMVRIINELLEFHETSPRSRGRSQIV